MKKTDIKVNPRLCTECLCCQLICSFTYLGAFNPLKAQILIEPRLEPGKETRINFTDDCVRGCSLCAQYCTSGALMRLKEKTAKENQS